MTLGLFFSTCTAQAEVLVARKLNFELGKYSDTSRDGYILSEKPKEQLDLKPKVAFSFDFWCGSSTCVYLDQEIIGKSTNVQYRFVSWILEGGIAIKNVDFFYWHQSQHSLESSALGGRYPNENTYGVRLKLVNNPRRGWE